MSEAVVLGAMLQCDQGIAPCSLIVIPARIMSDMKPVATVMDFTIANIPTFGMCKGTNSANPMVASLTAAAMGTPTPAPCIPVITAPWSSGAASAKATPGKLLTKDSTCKCAWTGSVSITDAGTTKVVAKT